MRLITAGLLTGVCDGLFSSVLARFFYGSTVTRLWQGVASTAFGADAFGGGTRLAIAGLVVHFGVAFAWSAIFLLAYEQLPALRRITASPYGVMKVAAVYGPLVWVVMSLAVIPMMTGRPPAITARWWTQFVGHAIFVGLPIASMISRTAKPV
jgi:uncharacterized membrane protein YagU involved in acid resistance